MSSDGGFTTGGQRQARGVKGNFTLYCIKGGQQG
jgi:hypothetical protein